MKIAIKVSVLLLVAILNLYWFGSLVPQAFSEKSEAWILVVILSPLIIGMDFGIVKAILKNKKGE